MNLGISNLAWGAGDDLRALPLLVAAGLHTVDVAPGKYAAVPGWPRPEAVRGVRDFWAGHGVAIGALQGLFFGRPELNLFGGASGREAMLTELSRVAGIARGLGASKLVFGAPRQRVRGALSEAEALAIAAPFLRTAGDIAASEGCVLCVEAAPVAYGGDFAVTTTEAAEWVGLAAHPSVKLQLDCGIVALTGESLAALLRAYAPLVGHVHLSEPGLGELGTSAVDHGETARLLAAHLPGVGATVEMLGMAGESALGALDRALRFAKRTYGAA